jgi:5-methylcytosine-specific restriction enzyme A
VALRTIQPRVAIFDARKVKPPPKIVGPFYQSPEWRELLAEIIAERGKVCEDPRCPTPRGPWSRIYGDHIHELRDGGAPLDRHNVLLRCATCHARKTSAERARRSARRFDGDGDAAG